MSLFCSVSSSGFSFTRGKPKIPPHSQSHTLAKSLFFLIILSLLFLCQSHCLLEPSQYISALALPRTDVGLSNSLSSFQSWLQCPFSMTLPPNGLIYLAMPHPHAALPISCLPFHFSTELTFF